MKLLFLDIDGVVNTNLQKNEWGIDFISPRMMGIVATIVNQTGCKIVLSSDWKKKQSDRDLVVEALKIAKIDHSLIGWTPDFSNMRKWASDLEPIRKREILSWMDNHSEPIEAFAVLDDMNLPMDNMFLIDDDIGITETIANKVIAHLGQIA